MHPKRSSSLSPQRSGHSAATTPAAPARGNAGMLPNRNAFTPPPRVSSSSEPTWPQSAQTTTSAHSDHFAHGSHGHAAGPFHSAMRPPFLPALDDPKLDSTTPIPGAWPKTPRADHVDDVAAHHQGPQSTAAMAQRQHTGTPPGSFPGTYSSAQPGAPKLLSRHTVQTTQVFLSARLEQQQQQHRHHSSTVTTTNTARPGRPATQSPPFVPIGQQPSSSILEPIKFASPDSEPFADAPSPQSPAALAGNVFRPASFDTANAAVQVPTPVMGSPVNSERPSHTAHQDQRHHQHRTTITTTSSATKVESQLHQQHASTSHSHSLQAQHRPHSRQHSRSQSTTPKASFLPLPNLYHQQPVPALPMLAPSLDAQSASARSQSHQHQYSQQHTQQHTQQPAQQPAQQHPYMETTSASLADFERVSAHDAREPENRRSPRRRAESVSLADVSESHATHPHIPKRASSLDVPSPSKHDGDRLRIPTVTFLVQETPGSSAMFQDLTTSSPPRLQPQLSTFTVSSSGTSASSHVKHVSSSIVSSIGFELPPDSFVTVASASPTPPSRPITAIPPATPPPVASMPAHIAIAGIEHPGSFPAPIPQPAQAQPAPIHVPARSSSLHSRQSVVSTASSSHIQNIQHMRDYSQVSSGSGSSSGSSSASTGMRYGPRRSSLMHSSGSRPASASGSHSEGEREGEGGMEQSQAPRVGPRSSSLSAAQGESGVYFEVQQHNQARRGARSSSYGEQIDGFVDCQNVAGPPPRPPRTPGDSLTRTQVSGRRHGSKRHVLMTTTTSSTQKTSSSVHHHHHQQHHSSSAASRAQSSKESEFATTTAALPRLSALLKEYPPSSTLSSISFASEPSDPSPPSPISSPRTRSPPHQPHSVQAASLCGPSDEQHRNEMNRSAMSSSIQGRLPSSAYQCLHGPSTPVDTATRTGAAAAAYASVCVQHDHIHGHAQQQQQQVNLYRSSSPSRRVSIDVQHLLPTHTSTSGTGRGAGSPHSNNPPSEKAVSIVSLAITNWWHVVRRWLIILNLIRATITTGLALYTIITTLPALVKPFDAVAFYTASVVFAVLDLSVAVIRALPRRWLLKRFGKVQWVPKAWLEGDRANVNTLSIWGLVAGMDLVLHIVPLLANAVIKVYHLRLIEISRSPNLSIVLPSVVPKPDNPAQPHSPFSSTVTSLSAPAAQLAIFVASLYITIIGHVIGIVHTLIVRKRAWTLSSLVIIKSALFTFDMTVLGIVLYQLLILKGPDLFGTVNDSNVRLALSIVALAPIANLASNAVVNYALHYWHIRMALQGRVFVIDDEPSELAGAGNRVRVSSSSSSSAESMLVQTVDGGIAVIGTGRNVSKARIHRAARRKTVQPVAIAVFGTFTLYASIVLVHLAGAVTATDPWAFLTNFFFPGVGSPEIRMPAGLASGQGGGSVGATTMSASGGGGWIETSATATGVGFMPMQTTATTWRAVSPTATDTASISTGLHAAPTAAGASAAATVFVPPGVIAGRLAVTTGPAPGPGATAAEFSANALPASSPEGDATDLAKTVDEISRKFKDFADEFNSPSRRKHFIALIVVNLLLNYLPGAFVSICYWLWILLLGLGALRIVDWGSRGVHRIRRGSSPTRTPPSINSPSRPRSPSSRVLLSEPQAMPSAALPPRPAANRPVSPSTAEARSRLMEPLHKLDYSEYLDADVDPQQRPAPSRRASGGNMRSSFDQSRPHQPEPRRVDSANVTRSPPMSPRPSSAADLVLRDYGDVSSDFESSDGAPSEGRPSMDTLGSPAAPPMSPLPRLSMLVTESMPSSVSDGAWADAEDNAGSASSSSRDGMDTASPWSPLFASEQQWGGQSGMQTDSGDDEEAADERRGRARSPSRSENDCLMCPRHRPAVGCVHVEDELSVARSRSASPCLTDLRHGHGLPLCTCDAAGRAGRHRVHPAAFSNRRTRRSRSRPRSRTQSVLTSDGVKVIEKPKASTWSMQSIPAPLRPRSGDVVNARRQSVEVVIPLPPSRASVRRATDSV